jgi:hypothetical protein
MSKKTVRVKLHRKSPDKLLKLLTQIKAKHNELGAASPLDPAEVAAIDAIVTAAKPKYEQAKTLAAQAQSLNEQVRVSLGIGKGQTVNTEGTGLYLIAGVRDQLLNVHRTNEEALSMYGFNVVIGSAQVGRPKKKVL